MPTATRKPAAKKAATRKPSKPKPDQWGRLRVRDNDTNAERTVSGTPIPPGNYTVLSKPASNPITGDPLPPKFPESPVEPTATGQQADSTKENDHA